MVKKEDSVADETTVKRRRKSLKGIDQNIDDASDLDSKPVLLPQKKRAFLSSNSPSQSPIKKSSKVSNGSSETGENVDNETLIRETEADLKSLSGSWPGPRHAFYNRGIAEAEDRFESPEFENLFDEKKNGVQSVTSSTASSGCSDNSSCSLKDVITLRDQQDAKNAKQESRLTNGNQGKQENTRSSTNSKSVVKSQKEEKEQHQKSSQEKNYLESLIKIENVCDSIQSQAKTKSRSEQGDKSNEKFPNGQRYEPDFNELVDDSSNELEIDMSEAEDRANKSEKHKKKEGDEKKEIKGGNSCGSQQKPEKVKANSTATFNAPTTTFRDGKEQPKLANNLDLQNSPIGPFPAGATFVGYPPATAPGVRLPPEEKPSTACLIPLKVTPAKVEPEDSSTNVTSSKISVSSPETPVSKQYTILQPAGAGSRAASAIQDVAREGVVSVPAVSSTSVAVSSTQNQTTASADSSSSIKSDGSRTIGSLSPSSIARGKYAVILSITQFTVFNNSVRINTLSVWRGRGLSII